MYNTIAQHSSDHTDSHINKNWSCKLPPELLTEIFSYLSDSQTTLYAISLVSKQWLHSVAPMLYECPRLYTTYRWATFILTLTRDRMYCFYGDLVRSIDLSSTKSRKSRFDPELFKSFRDHNTNGQSRSHQHIYYNAPTIQRSNQPHHERFNDMESEDFMYKSALGITISTSSMIQLAHACKNLTSINLSYSNMFYDSLIAETGEYLSTLQHYAIHPGLTQIQISLEQAIQAIGQSCQNLTYLKIQRCDWVTAQTIWFFVAYCPNLKKLDAAGSNRCSVKALTTNVLDISSDYSASKWESYTLSGQVNLDPIMTNSSSSSTNTTDEDILQLGTVFIDFRENEVADFAMNDDEVMQERMINYNEQNNNHNPWMFGSPRPTYEHELNEHQQIQMVDVNKTLKEIVTEIIRAAKDSGVQDLAWFQDDSVL